ncbi:hypothetical protein D3C72_2262400 [compost metagenome]
MGGRRRGAAGVIDQDVDVPQLLLYACDMPVDGRQVGKIPVQRQGPSAGHLDGPRGSRCRFHIHVRHSDASTFLRQRGGHGGAQATTTAEHKRRAVFDLQVHQYT